MAVFRLILIACLGIWTFVEAAPAAPTTLDEIYSSASGRPDLAWMRIDQLKQLSAPAANAHFDELVPKLEAGTLTQDDLRHALFPDGHVGYVMTLFDEHDSGNRPGGKRGAQITASSVLSCARKKLANATTTPEEIALYTKLKALLVAAGEQTENRRKTALAYWTLVDRYATQFSGGYAFDDVGWVRGSRNLSRAARPQGLPGYHPCCYDAFFPKYADAENLVGPVTDALYGGVVVAALGGWSVDGGQKITREQFDGFAANPFDECKTRTMHVSGGLSPERGNGVVVYNPKFKEAWLYVHLADHASEPIAVKAGDVVRAGALLAHAGGSGLNAQRYLSIYAARAPSDLHTHMEAHRICPGGTNRGSPLGAFYVDYFFANGTRPPETDANGKPYFACAQ